MDHADFVALHVHSEYSLLDGAIRIPELVSRSREYKMPAVAVTDHGNMFGAVEFYKAATKAGVKPLMGCEVYIAPGSRTERSPGPGGETAYHVVLFARDNDGYRNLMALVSRAYLEGFYYKPRIDRDLLEQYSGGLLALSACMQGEVPYHLRAGNIAKAREAALWYKHVLGPENFYLELQENGLKEQEELNRKLYELGRELHIGLVATNDCHYLNREDARAHDILLCIQTAKTLSDPGRMRFDGDGFYFRSPEEMKLAFRDLPEAILNTRAIAERCNVELKFGESLLPRIVPPDGSKPSEYLSRLAREGLAARMHGEPTPEYVARLERELDVIKKMGYASYFLIVEDFISWSRQQEISVGPGRGSAAGSLVAYSIGITGLDPLAYGLLFERFLNPERVSMPDIDVDFCKDRRPEVLSYVAEKYGRDHVAQIITFGTMAAKAAIRDVARVMDFPYAEADRIAKLVPDTLKITLKQSMKDEPQLKELYDKDERVRDLIDVAMRLEGLSRHASTHAAGVVIAPRPITEFVPLYRHPGDESITTQFDMSSVEAMGLIKFDFLGLKTLTLIEKAIEYLREGGVELDIDAIPLDDRRTYEFLGTGQSTGVFQLESEGMKDILVKMQPSRFEDLIALVALYRPGPIKSGMIDDFIKRKRGEKEVRYEIPELKAVLDETYGVIIYQEQVMSIANRLADFTMGQADTLRKAMGKKKADVMAEMKEAFREGAKKKGIDEGRAERLFDLMAYFAEYGFNKSHSAAYALISYQTAYLKAHHPEHFMAATLSCDLDSTDKIVKSIKECKSMGITILPPDVNLCRHSFAVVPGGIRFGLQAVKGVGAGAIDAVIEARDAGGPFATVEDFSTRVDTRRVNKKVLEALVKAGAMDSLDPNRAGGRDGGRAGAHDPDPAPACGREGDRPPSDAAPSLADLVLWRPRALELVALGEGGAPTLDLFGGMDDPGAPTSSAWDHLELLRAEKEALGFYISGNPLMKYRLELAALDVRTASDLDSVSDRQEVQTAGLISAIKKMRTRKGDLMASLTVEDAEGSVEVVVFPDLYRENTALIEKDTPVLVRGTLEKSEKGQKVIARELLHLGEMLSSCGEGHKVMIDVRNRGESRLGALKSLVAARSGPIPLYLRIRSGAIEATIQTSLAVRPDPELIAAVEDLCGAGTFKVLG